MFKRFDVHLVSNPVCTKPVDMLEQQDFSYYDKDGFELCLAEQKFYRAMNFPINNPILNHICWQQPWFELERTDSMLMLDHCMFLCRAGFEDQARQQLIKFKSEFPKADLLLNTKAKWGFDLALDAVIDGTVFEVLHIEYDHRDYETFTNHMITFEYKIRHTDWFDAARKVYNSRDQWEHLKGFDQNNWKANYLLGWTKAEYTEKTI